MGRLIDAEKTLDKECESCLCERGCVNCDFCELNKVLSAAPTVDAEPVKHGHWIEKDDGWEWVYYDCSVCGNSWTTIDGTPSDNGMSYCPNCGAKMDEEVEHGRTKTD